MPFTMFPHTYFPVGILKRIGLFFGHFTICMPWYMNDESIKDQDNTNIVHPPESLKPSREINSIALELEKWMADYEDRSYREILKSGQAIMKRDENTWEIRENMRYMLGHSSKTDKDLALKWHLTLLLARKIEEQRIVADNALKKIKQKKSILEGSIEKVDEHTSLLGDLSPFDSDIIIGESNISRILEAWLSLFGNSISRNEILITLDYRVFDFISGLWDSNGIDLLWPEMKFILSFEYLHHLERKTGKESDDSAYLQSTKLRNLILKLQEDVPAGLDGLKKHAEKFGTNGDVNSSDESVHITIKHLSPPSDWGPFEKDFFISSLAGKTITYMESV